MPQVRVINAEGEQLGIMATNAALFKAREAGLDLVEVAPNAQPPVCKIIDFSRYLYEEKKKQKEARKNQRTITWKEVRLEPLISPHDLETKAHSAERFLKEGNKLKVTLRFRGRQMAHPDIGRKLLLGLATRVGETGSIEQQPLLEGKQMIMVMVPKRAPTSPAPASA